VQAKAFIHIGYTKAASTSLQAMFAASPKVHFVDRVELMQRLVFRNSFLYEPGAAGEFIDEQRRIAAENGQVLMVSHERLAGNPHSGHYDSKEIAFRLKGLLPDAVVLMVLREQMSMLASIYKQYIRIGGVRRLRDYLLPPADHRVPLFEWQSYRYDVLLEYYYEVFGRSSVRVLLFEDLLADPDAFFGQVAEVLGVDVPESFDTIEPRYAGIPENRVERRRIINLFRRQRASIRDEHPLQRRWLEKLAAGALCVLPFAARRYSDKRPCVREVRRIFRGRFAESNRKLAKLIDRDTAALGYETDNPRSGERESG